MDDLQKTIELVEEKAGAMDKENNSLITRGFVALLELYRLQNERIDDLEQRLYRAGVIKDVT